MVTRWVQLTEKPKETRLVDSLEAQMAMQMALMTEMSLVQLMVKCSEQPTEMLTAMSLGSSTGG